MTSKETLFNSIMASIDRDLFDTRNTKGIPQLVWNDQIEIANTSHTPTIVKGKTKNKDIFKFDIRTKRVDYHVRKVHNLIKHNSDLHHRENSLLNDIVGHYFHKCSNHLHLYKIYNPKGKPSTTWVSPDYSIPTTNRYAEKAFITDNIEASKAPKWETFREDLEDYDYEDSSPLPESVTDIPSMDENWKPDPMNLKFRDFERPTMFDNIDRTKLEDIESIDIKLYPAMYKFLNREGDDIEIFNKYYTPSQYANMKVSMLTPETLSLGKDFIQQAKNCKVLVTTITTDDNTGHNTHANILIIERLSPTHYEMHYYEPHGKVSSEGAFGDFNIKNFLSGIRLAMMGADDTITISPLDELRGSLACGIQGLAGDRDVDYGICSLASTFWVYNLMEVIAKYNIAVRGEFPPMREWIHLIETYYKNRYYQTQDSYMMFYNRLLSFTWWTTTQFANRVKSDFIKSTFYEVSHEPDEEAMVKTEHKSMTRLQYTKYMEKYAMSDERLKQLMDESEQHDTHPAADPKWVSFKYSDTPHTNPTNRRRYTRLMQMYQESSGLLKPLQSESKQHVPTGELGSFCKFQYQCNSGCCDPFTNTCIKCDSVTPFSRKTPSKVSIKYQQTSLQNTKKRERIRKQKKRDADKRALQDKMMKNKIKEELKKSEILAKKQDVASSKSWFSNWNFPSWG